jgi:hypothetical protein
LSDNKLPSLAQTNRTSGALQHIRLSHAEARPTARLSTPVEDEHDRAHMPPSRHISMTATPHAKSYTPVEVEIHRPNAPSQNEPELQRDNSAPLSTSTVEDEVANRHDLELAPWSKLVKFPTPPTARARTLFEDENTGEDDFELVSPSPSPLQDSFSSSSAVIFQDLKIIVHAFTR